ncbi:MAG: OB-fold domain-containing protein [Proteobacteria bacterium]|nr:OB-fold domain-containing protein [Pseudomonadota bacterium]
MSAPYLADGLPIPLATELDRPFWDGLRQERLLLQRCRACHRFQWGPEWICHRCQNFDLAYIEVPPEGRIYSYQRVWHPVHPALRTQGPYLIALIEIPHADNVRMVGNLLGDPRQAVAIGAEVEGVFEQHAEAEPPFALLQWQLV